ncbi:hypothetical protein J6590_023570 [Homalodisca vitripennis]|nr:hypothetical protein J6590_023570 [Homalodisca vitripennis]
MEFPIVVTARCKIRAVIRFLNAKQISPIEIHDQLIEVYGENCTSVQHVRKWCREFSEGRMEIHDENRSGRPSVSDGVVEKVETILLEDRPSPLQPKPSPSDYHSFPKLKEHLGGKRFSTDDEVKEEVTRILKGLMAEFYNMVIEKLEHRLQECFDRNGPNIFPGGSSGPPAGLEFSILLTPWCSENSPEKISGCTTGGNHHNSEKGVKIALKSCLSEQANKFL